VAVEQREKGILARHQSLKKAHHDDPPSAPESRTGNLTGSRAKH
jgi:hypothetical protein